MNIQDLSVETLKAMAYDSMAQLQQNQNNIAIINQELDRRSKMENSSDSVEKPAMSQSGASNEASITNVPEENKKDVGKQDVKTLKNGRK